MIAKGRLSDRSVKALKHKRVRYDVFEPGHTGLAVRIAAKPSTRKTWQYFFRAQKEGKSIARRMRLGEYPAVSLKSARRKLTDAKREKEHGRDPGKIAKEQRAADRNAETVREVAEEYLADRVRGKLASASEEERILNKDVLPAIGAKKAKDVRRRHIKAILDKIRGRNAPAMANRTLAVCSRLFGYAIECEYIEASPTYRLSPSKQYPRDRVLSPAEVRMFWGGLANTDLADRFQLALRFLLITGQRRSEVVMAKVAEFDLKERLWELPPGRMKKRRPHVVPLSDLALELLAEIKTKCGDGEFLFPSPRGGERSYSPKSLSFVVLGLGADLGMDPWTPHDLRRTVNTEMGRIGIPQSIIDRVQGRIESGTGARHYNRYDYLVEKRDALERWAERLTVLIGDDAKVVDLATRSA